jgi:glycosyltransferase involved in cell wall biosynthesis/peptidoglycan/xylan/chitin deacetylase (PgdA/CDA1 family)
MERLSKADTARTMGNPDPTVTVVIPCYNLGAYLDQAVQSVLDQTFRDFEIIIVDDGSTDHATRQLFSSYQRPRTRVLRTENRGLAEARNLGIREARGRYISCLDADDLLEPAFLGRAVDILESDPDLAFASCWLRAFGDYEFLWSPATCDFPHLLAEDTVCTAALMRKDGVLQTGGFDPRMPVPGCEDWDLAITLVERGLPGVVIPEFLFRRRIRSGSASGSSPAPADHARLMRYMVEKHAESYRKHVAGVLETIEKRTWELEDRPCGQPPAPRPEEEARIGQLEGILRGILESRNWRLSRPLRLGYGFLKRMRARQAVAGGLRRDVSVIVTCHNQGEVLTTALESIRSRIGGRAEIIIVDAGSTSPLTRQVLDWYCEAGFRVVRTMGRGLTQARAAGFRKARAPVVFAMGADETVEPAVLQKALELLSQDAGAAFVQCGLQDETNGFTWLPESADVPGLLACPRLSFPVVRRSAMFHAGGYDEGMPDPLQADWDLAIRLAIQGQKGIVLPEPLLKRRFRRTPLVAPLLEKHRALFQRHWSEPVLGHENRRRVLQACFEGPAAAPPEASPVPVQWGSLRSLEPVSRVWGLDRGEPIDRYYIRQFLTRHGTDVRGKVLEVKDSAYTRIFGASVEAGDVVDIEPANPSATLVCDLSSRGSLPEDTYDCFLLTQTIHFIYDARAAIENAYRTLRPGGVLLATLPCLSRVDYEAGQDGDFWRFTPAAVRLLFEEVFGAGAVEIESFGNVLAGTSFLLGLSAADLSPGELDYRDPYFPLIVCARAVKGGLSPDRPRARSSIRDEKALVLLYHRVDHPAGDRWNLCVSPANFAAHMSCIRRLYNPVRLSELGFMLERGSIRTGSVAVTFDDGYRDNFTTAIPVLKETKVPATFFLSGDGVSNGVSFWWERLNASLRLMLEEDAVADRLHLALLAADVDERERILAGLPQPVEALPERMSGNEFRALAGEPLADLGAHGWSHRALAEIPLESQRREVADSIRMVSELTGSAVRVFAYPFGGPVSPQLIEVLKENGIRAALTVETAAVTPGCDPFRIPRFEVRDWGEKEFEERLRALLDR